MKYTAVFLLLYAHPALNEQYTNVLTTYVLLFNKFQMTCVALRFCFLEKVSIDFSVLMLTFLQIKIATTGDIRSRWQQWSEQHIEGQKLNPFSEEFDYEYSMAQRLHKGDSGYGRPKEGSKTAERGDRAQKHIYREMEEMVWIIRDMGFKDKEGRTIITFGRLFDRYVKISDKVVGILLRCRKHKMLDFEGEMVWKGQDDDVIITLKD